MRKPKYELFQEVDVCFWSHLGGDKTSTEWLTDFIIVGILYTGPLNITYHVLNIDDYITCLKDNINWKDMDYYTVLKKQESDIRPCLVDRRKIKIEKVKKES